MYLNNILPSFFVEDVLSEVFFENRFSFGDLFEGHNRTRQPVFENVLQPEEQGLLELSSSTLKVRVNVGGVWWVLEVVCNLNTKYKKLVNIKSSLSTAVNYDLSYQQW